MQTLPKSQMIKCLFIFIFLIHIAADNSVYAESLRLTSGLVLEGTILSESEKVIIIQTAKGTFTIKKTDILEMERPGSKDIIVKPPVEDNPSIPKLLALGFIPGYSPIYKSKERPEFGIPFAMLSLNYFYRFLQFQTNSRAVGFMDSVEMKEPLVKLYNLTMGPRIAAYETGSMVYTTFQPSGNFDLGPNLYQYVNFRSVLYNRNPDRVVMGNTMTEEEYLNKRRSLFQNYLAVSLAGSIAAYFILNSESTAGVLKTEHKGIQTIFYAFPTPDGGGSFGSVSKF